MTASGKAKKCELAPTRPLHPVGSDIHEYQLKFTVSASTGRRTATYTCQCGASDAEELPPRAGFHSPMGHPIERPFERGGKR